VFNRTIATVTRKVVELSLCVFDRFNIYIAVRTIENVSGSSQLFFLHLIQLEAVNFERHERGWTAKRPRRNWLRKSPSVSPRKKKEGGRYGVIRGTDQLTPIVKENERLHKEAEDEEPMELRRKTS
jgi:hypothetical protein